MQHVRTVVVNHSCRSATTRAAPCVPGTRRRVPRPRAKRQKTLREPAERRARRKTNHFRAQAETARVDGRSDRRGSRDPWRRRETQQPAKWPPQAAAERCRLRQASTGARLSSRSSTISPSPPCPARSNQPPAQVCCLLYSNHCLESWSWKLFASSIKKATLSFSTT